MQGSLEYTVFPILLLISFSLSTVSGLSLLNPKVPLKYVRLHIGVIALSPIIALFALFFSHNKELLMGPLSFNTLSWLVVFFVQIIGLIVQRYAVYYLLGDTKYRNYFLLLTLLTVSGSVAWLSNDGRMLLVSWGLVLVVLFNLIRLNSDWEVARKAAQLSGKVFALSWLFLFVTILWLSITTGNWQLSTVLSENNLIQLALWEKTGIGLLLIGSVIIPAAQWPFHNWLLSTVVTPTPVSAVMHAGIVNAGGIILTNFAPLFKGTAAPFILLIIASISVLIGTGIMLVQVDYKRQLVGSTIAQMGFMLIQCALGAYVAAITHAVLHGMFKSTLFLRSGTIIHHEHPHIERNTNSHRYMAILGMALGILIGVGYWKFASWQGYHLISAIIIGWSFKVAWNQLLLVKGRFGSLIGVLMVVFAGVFFMITHKLFGSLLAESVHMVNQPTNAAIIYMVILLLFAGVMGIWLTYRQSSKLYTIIYLWLVRLGEPNYNSIESHPYYLTRLLSKGGPMKWKQH
ncbi:NADH dehydrogenase subunit 5 [Oceanobacillus senegalensis]|uniref:NADH dehydrogenase subunit 5 n=1 Tax=Oceanobacillus senegalensis TaxID=1936063 RepID=UPI000A30ECC8|nr:NADH dehydrogenase subunit 5 [Oceanobacillus senegalensis]